MFQDAGYTGNEILADEMIYADYNPTISDASALMS